MFVLFEQKGQKGLADVASPGTHSCVGDGDWCAGGFRKGPVGLCARSFALRGSLDKHSFYLCPAGQRRRWMDHSAIRGGDRWWYDGGETVGGGEMGGAGAQAGAGAGAGATNGLEP